MIPHEYMTAESRDLLAGSGLSVWSWRKRAATTLLMVVVGVGLTLAAFNRARRTERVLARTEFESAAKQAIARLEGTLELDQSFLRSLASFFDASVEVTREEFAALTSPAFVQPIGLQALGWVPRVRGSERESYEAAARLYYPDFSFRERAPSGEIVIAATHEEYFPVYYAEPLKGNEAALGLDFLSDPIRRKALNRAWEAGEPKATDLLTLIQREGGQQGFLIFVPIYEHTEEPTRSLGEAADLRGFAVGIVRINGLIERAIGHSDGQASAIEIEIQDLTDAEASDEIGLEGHQLVGSRDLREWSLVRNLNVAGRVWQLVCTPDAEFGAFVMSGDSRTVLWAGILTTLFLSSYAFFLMVHAARNTEFAERLARTEELYRRVVETMRDGLVVLDKNGLLTYVNDRFCEITGRSREEFLGNPATRFLDEENRAKVEREFGKRGTQERESYEIQWKLMNGRQVWAIVGPSPVFETDGTFQGSIATLTDITELKNAESKVRAAMQAKNDFLATISHEMRTPLNGIIGMSRLLLRAGLPDQERQYATLLESSADSMLQLINGILDFSKIEADKIKLEAMNFRVEDSLREVKAILGPRAAAKGIDLRFEGMDQLGECVGDPLRLRQVLLNILGNAIKFTEEGYVSVQAERIEGLDEKVEFRFTVRDTGIGISADAQPFIFGSFTQADTSTSRLFGGTGLGLAISKRLVELMGGEIGVRSNTEGGSTFWFTVTLEKPSEKSVYTPSKILAGTSARSRAREEFHVLVADDNEVNRLVALRELEYLGYQATAVSDGTEVLGALREGHYDLVLMDCQMPKLDGFETTSRIRGSESGGHRLPIIAVTAYTMKDDVKKCLAAGMDDYISKPFNTDQLQQVVDRWLSFQASGAEVGKPAREVRLDPQTGVNLRALNRLRDIAGDEGEDTVEAIVEVFLRQMPAILKNFHRLDSSQDAKGLAEVAHSLCGSASTIGAFRLSDLCRELEAELQSQGLEATTSRLEEIFNEIGVVQESLRDCIAQIEPSAG